MELRIRHPRTTKDIDLALRDQSLTSKDSKAQDTAILKELRDLASIDLGDFFIFQIRNSAMDIMATPYGGARFPVIAQVDGRVFSRFHLDIVVGDTVIEPLDVIKGEDWLGFAGLHTKEFPTLSVEQHFAEKIHAYTLPRNDKFNSRVKDLIDLILLIRMNKLNLSKLKIDIEKVFSGRKTHEMPRQISLPPSEWEQPFANMAEECYLSLKLDDAFNELSGFLKQLT